MVHGQEGWYGCEYCGGVRGNLDGTGKNGTGRITCPTCGGRGKVGSDVNASPSQQSSDNADAERQRALEQQRRREAEEARQRQEQFERAKDDAL